MILLKVSYASPYGYLGFLVEKLDFPVARLLDFKRQKVEAAGPLKASLKGTRLYFCILLVGEVTGPTSI